MGLWGCLRGTGSLPGRGVLEGWLCRVRPGPRHPRGPCPLRVRPRGDGAQKPAILLEVSAAQFPGLGLLSAPIPLVRGSALTGSPASPFSPGSPGFPLSPWNTEQIKVRGQIPFISKKLVRRTLYLRTKKVPKAIPSSPLCACDFSWPILGPAWSGPRSPPTHPTGPWGCPAPAGVTPESFLSARSCCWGGRGGWGAEAPRRR